MESIQVVTVSQVNQYLKIKIERDSKLSDLYVKGEISNFTNHFKTGHFYFTLKDDNALIKAVMFKGNAQKVRFTPENGMKVIIRGRVGVFERDGIYQIYATEMEPDGIGALHLAYEQLKEKLYKEGLFDERYKKPLPRYPEKIGIVTSETGAAIQDMLNVIGRRYKLCDIILYPALVQGEEAPAQIIKGISFFNTKQKVDVIIIGRGGGSIEDLWAFNDEGVARAVFASEIPIVSAVGHEVDYTITDFVADLRAPTPSAAAELCVPDTDSLRYTLASLDMKMTGGLQTRLKGLQSRLDLLRNRPCLLDAGYFVTHLKNKLAMLVSRPCLNDIHYLTGKQRETLTRLSSLLDASVQRCISGKRERFTVCASKLDALSPLKVISRGYAIVTKGGQAVTRVADAAVGDSLSLRVEDGVIKATVTDI